MLILLNLFLMNFYWSSPGEVVTMIEQGPNPELGSVFLVEHIWNLWMQAPKCSAKDKEEMQHVPLLLS